MQARNAIVMTLDDSQRTFTAVPSRIGHVGNDLPRDGVQRPMTSKKARQEYLKRTRGPRMSKEDQRQRERELQDEIRRDIRRKQEEDKKEKDRERAQARTKAQRERQRAKDDADKKAKRQAGVPIKPPRPSQDTIARFMRGNGTSKKRDATGQSMTLVKNQNDVKSAEADRKPLATSSETQSIQVTDAETTTSHVPSEKVNAKPDIAQAPLCQVQGEGATSRPLDCVREPQAENPVASLVGAPCKSHAQNSDADDRVKHASHQSCRTGKNQAFCSVIDEEALAQTTRMPLDCKTKSSQAPKAKPQRSHQAASRPDLSFQKANSGDEETLRGDREIAEPFSMQSPISCSSSVPTTTMPTGQRTSCATAQPARGQDLNAGCITRQRSHESKDKQLANELGSVISSMPPTRLDKPSASSRVSPARPDFGRNGHNAALGYYHKRLISTRGEQKPHSADCLGSPARGMVLGEEHELGLGTGIDDMLDLFPSGTQLQRELEVDLDDSGVSDVGSEVLYAEAKHVQPLPAKQAFDGKQVAIPKTIKERCPLPDTLPFFSTQDCELSSEDVSEIESSPTVPHPRLMTNGIPPHAVRDPTMRRASPLLRQVMPPTKRAHPPRSKPATSKPSHLQREIRQSSSSSRSHSASPPQLRGSIRTASLQVPVCPAQRANEVPSSSSKRRKHGFVSAEDIRVLQEVDWDDELGAGTLATQVGPDALNTKASTMACLSSQDVLALQHLAWDDDDF